ncbi:hypothetical protein CLU79DRAFT_760901 [Phycomyces nitens]|nr:hypothetical protein CLU79DRAFT_760901 [Phycomyces nitens]
MYIIQKLFIYIYFCIHHFLQGYFFGFECSCLFSVCFLFFIYICGFTWKRCTW